ncbi:hypothetical protein BC826DRAFT_998413, partial [Russula brevipes]
IFLLIALLALIPSLSVHLLIVSKRQDASSLTIPVPQKYCLHQVSKRFSRLVPGRKWAGILMHDSDSSEVIRRPRAFRSRHSDSRGTAKVGHQFRIISAQHYSAPQIGSGC